MMPVSHLAYLKFAMGERLRRKGVKYSRDSLSLLVERFKELSWRCVDDSHHQGKDAVCQHQRVPAPNAPEFQRGLLSCRGFVGATG